MNNLEEDLLFFENVFSAVYVESSLLLLFVPDFHVRHLACLRRRPPTSEELCTVLIILFCHRETMIDVQLQEIKILGFDT